MKNSSDRTGLDGAGPGIVPRHSEARAARLIGSSASCMNVRSRPNGLRSASASRRYASTLSVLLVCAAAIFIISSVATVPVGDASAVKPDPPQVTEPRPPYYVAGFTYDAFGAPLANCLLNLTDLNTGEWNNTEMSDASGFYMIDVANGWLSGHTVGDAVNVTATKDVAIGWTEAVLLPGGYTQVDVTLNAEIPEFPLVALPVVGIIAMFTVVSLKRRRDKL